MKILSTFLVVVFLLSCTTIEQEKKNPLEGTTWELTSGKWVREDSTLTFPNSPHDQAIIIFGKTHYSLVAQDTSRDYNWFILAKYTVDGDNLTPTFKMAINYKEIGSSFTGKIQIDVDQLIIEATDYNIGDYKWKNYREVWKRID